VNGLKYAIDYAPKEATIVIAWDEKTEPKTIELETRKDKVDFIEKLSKEDTIYMELGGGGDRFVIGARRKGASVFRLPSYEVKKFRQERRLAKGETAQALKILAQERPKLFYPVQEIDEKIAKLRMFARGYLLIQRKLRIAAELRLDSIYRDLWLIEKPTGELDEETYVKQKIAESLIFKGAEAIEKEMLNEIKKLLPEIPIYEIFEKIPGCGPLIAGLCIGEIGDIRRFPTEHTLVAYAGYHVTEEGKAAVRRKGQTANWNNNLRHAVWLFTTQTVERLPPDSPWKAKLIARKEREAKLHPDFPKIRIAKRARRWLGTKFLRHIWREWRKIEGLA
jgi:hypothetical protein